MLKGLSREEISGQGTIFFIAGFNTTHATLHHAIYYLTQYHNWQERLFEELDGARDNLDHDALKRLPILNAIINETLRLKPPFIFVTREANEETELKDLGIKIPKNTLISIQAYMIHRNPKFFPDPLEFKPTRFLEDRSLEWCKAYMPFGGGPRFCVGMRFALDELRIGLAHFVLNYKVDADPGYQLEYSPGSFIMSPKALMVRISER